MLGDDDNLESCIEYAILFAHQGILRSAEGADDKKQRTRRVETLGMLANDVFPVFPPFAQVVQVVLFDEIGGIGRQTNCEGGRFSGTVKPDTPRTNPYINPEEERRDGGIYCAAISQAVWTSCETALLTSAAATVPRCCASYRTGSGEDYRGYRLS